MSVIDFFSAINWPEVIFTFSVSLIIWLSTKSRQIWNNFFNDEAQVFLGNYYGYAWSAKSPDNVVESLVTVKRNLLGIMKVVEVFPPNYQKEYIGKCTVDNVHFGNFELNDRHGRYPLAWKFWTPAEYDNQKLIVGIFTGVNINLSISSG